VKTLQTKNQKGFTLIELLVVIAIIGLLASVVLLSLNSARARSRDARRVADIAQLRSALELYLNDNGTYPTALASLAPSYINPIPTPPNPADGTCASAVAYTYAQTVTGYTLNFCLGSTAGQYGTGNRVLTPAGVQ
jgi:prepilin-type N-terminal cleavage/methylation domain-containing protein